MQVLTGQEHLSPILGEGRGEGGGFAVRIGFGFSTEYKMSLQAKFPLL